MIPRLTPEELRQRVERGVRVVDVREPPVFADAHVRGSLNIALSNRGAPMWAHRLLALNDEVVVIAATEREGAMAEQLFTMAERRVAGFAPFDARAFAEARLPIDSIRTLPAPELARERERLTVLDVREEQEYAAGHVPGAVWIPLGELPARLAEVPDGPVATICASGFRSSTAASLLEAAGRSDLTNVWGGTTAWMQAGLPVHEGTKP